MKKALEVFFLLVFFTMVVGLIRIATNYLFWSEVGFTFLFGIYVGVFRTELINAAVEKVKKLFKRQKTS